MSIDVSSGECVSDLDMGGRIVRRIRLYGALQRRGDAVPTYFEWYEVLADRSRHSGDIYPTLDLAKQAASAPLVKSPPVLVQRFEFVTGDQRGRVMRVVTIDAVTEMPTGGPSFVAYYADGTSVTDFKASTDEAAASLWHSILSKTAPPATPVPKPPKGLIKG